MERKSNDGFSYTYSASEQAEIRSIREKYTEKPREESSMERLRRLDARPTQRAQTVSLILGVVGVLILGILSVLFPMLSRFENPLPVLLKNTVFLGMANLPRTIALGILNAAAALACAFYILPLFFLPSLAALIGSLLIEPMFRPYMPAEDAAE